MRILSVSYNHHKVFGDTKINFFDDSERETDDLLKKHHADIVFNIDRSTKENYYTFIIGDNGIGKSVLLRNIIHYSNWNSKMNEPRLDAIINLNPESSYYKQFKTNTNGAQDLINIQIYNKDFIAPGTNDIDFLKYYDAQLIFINGTYEKAIIHPNARFRSFNYATQLNETKILFLNSLIRFKNDEKLKNLGRFLGTEETQWTLRCGLAISARTVKNKEDNKSIYVLNNSFDITIFSFLSFINTIQIDNNERFITEGLSQLELSVLNAVYRSPFFFKLYFNFGMSFKELFENIRANHIIARIEEFLRVDIDALNAEKTLNVRITDEQKDMWDKLITEDSDLSEFDSFLLNMLFSLDILDIQIFANGNSIDVMSSGQKNLLRLFSYFSDMPLPKQLNNCIILFDEPENSLHPKWQQEFPLNFKLIAENIYGITGSHFIFATHSPVLLMKSALLNNSNVLRFYNDEQGQFRSEKIKNVNAYSIEEVLLDEFKITYRNQGAGDAMRKILDDEFQKRGQSGDPINAVKNAFDLRDKINDLYNELNREP
ncbi:ATP-binding protein [Chitinophaga agrisoli]|uniref:ATP-binding protein n=1 Tax=Chitinophaga agrisoli TaxID=2607653 RepID=A0A5B2VN96_9BACT|nr:AAA family ATPase [Chitinophaga agrisoli]KAA2239619.1 ATP-binding protein [Chitinophaga agrisoli]